MAWALIIGVAVAVVATCFYERREDARSRIHMGNYWLVWRSRHDADAWTPIQRHVGDWDVRAEDRGPTGRIDMTPGGRK